MDKAQLKQKVMRRVYIHYTLRTLTTPLLLKSYCLATMALGMTLFVSVTNVLANMAGVSGGTSRILYFMDAFLKTEIITQALLLGIVAVALWLVVDVVHGVRTTAFARA